MFCFKTNIFFFYSCYGYHSTLSSQQFYAILLFKKKAPVPKTLGKYTTVSCISLAFFHFLLCFKLGQVKNVLFCKNVRVWIWVWEAGGVAKVMLNHLQSKKSFFFSLNFSKPEIMQQQKNTFLLFRVCFLCTIAWWVGNSSG